VTSVEYAEAIPPLDDSEGGDRMKRFLVALAVIALTVSPALANECPTLQAQIDAQLGTRYDPGATNAKALAAEAWALHQAGKHAESVAKYDEAAKAAGITLQHKQ